VRHMTRTKRLNRRDLILGTITVLIIVYILAPILIVLITSFTKTAYLTFPPQGFTLSWYAKAFRTRAFIQGLTLSLMLGLVAATVSLVLGFLTSYALTRHNFRGKSFVNIFCQTPVLVPTIILGVSMLMYFSLLGLSTSFLTLAIGHTLITLPYAFRVLLPSLRGIDKSYEDAALSLGASRLRAFWVVLLPLMKPAIFSSVLFSFVVSFGNLSLSLFLAKPGVAALPVVLFQKAEYGLDPSLNAIASVFVLLSVTAVFIIQKTIGLRAVMK
jgi:putative spermidine/putrescine transport system permease protein